MLRTLLAFLAGVIAMMGTLIALEAFGHFIWSPPPVDMDDPAQWEAFIAAMPMTAKVWILISYATAVEVGTIIAVLIQRPRWRGLAMSLGLLMTVLIAVNFWMHSHPWWMVVIGLLLPLPVAMACGWWLRPKPGANA